MTRLPPAARGVAMVFQSYALYPHMKVADNITFGLKTARAEKADIAKRLQRATKMLQLEQLLDRKPAQLSGGQRQRVAIGRAIVRDPQVFLFDEPLSNLDAALRSQMRIEIAGLHDELGTTMIYVTHDQVEAMTMADKIVVLNSGRVEQVGAPLELYHRPANLFVAGFIGSPKMNFINGEISRGYSCADPRHPLRAHRRRQRQPDLAGRSGPRRKPRLRQLPLRRHRRRGAGPRPQDPLWADADAAARLVQEAGHQDGGYGGPQVPNRGHLDRRVHRPRRRSQCVTWW